MSLPSLWGKKGADSALTTLLRTVEDPAQLLSPNTKSTDQDKTREPQNHVGIMWSLT